MSSNLLSGTEVEMAIDVDNLMLELNQAHDKVEELESLIEDSVSQIKGLVGDIDPAIRRDIEAVLYDLTLAIK